MTSRRGFTWIELCVVIAIIVVLLALVGAPFAIQFVFYTVVYGLLGWSWFLARTLPDVEWHGPGLVLGLVGVLVFANLLHVVLKRWMKRSAESAEASDAIRWSWRQTTSVVLGMGLLFAAGTSLVGAVHEAVWCARSEHQLFRFEGGMRSEVGKLQSQSNLKQLVLAAHNIAAGLGTGTLPQGGRFDAEGRQLYGWMTALLPAVDHAPLYRAIHRDQPWQAPDNREFYTTTIRSFQSPHLAGAGRQRTAEGYALAHYSGNSWIFARPEGYSLDEIATSDGTTQTLLLGEINANFRAWGDAANWRDPALGLDTSPDGFGSPFRGSVDFAMADGSVRSLNKRIDPAVLRALATPAGGEQVDPRDY